jgi:hypothetical protein
MTSSRARVAANGLRSRTIFSDRATDPPVGRRSVRNDPVSIFSHPFLVFGEVRGDLRLPAELLDVFQRRGLARKTSELGRFGAIVLGIRHLLNLSVAVPSATGLSPAYACHRTGAAGRGLAGQRNASARCQHKVLAGPASGPVLKKAIAVQR